MKRHLFLIGMPGCGKSSFGRRLAGKLKADFEDTDDMIVRAAGMSVGEIFAKYGEDAFRKAETGTLVRLGGRRPCVVATGGGLPMKEENRKLLRAFGTVVLLDRPLEHILSDIRTEERPLLKENGGEKLKQLYEIRMPVYRELADEIVVNDGPWEQTLERLRKIAEK